jgi:Trypsin-like peptidase domain
VTLALPSLQSLFLTATVSGNLLGTATGFVVMHEEQPYLITNWHVVSGRDPNDGQPIDKSGATPDTIHIRHLLPPVPGSNLLSWRDFDEPLYDDETPRWLEHRVHKRRVDAVALPLTNATSAHLIPYELTIQPSNQLKAVVSDFVNIVGFPFGIAAGGSIGVWMKGAIASEPELNFNDLPCFLIDARTRQGQSGSPVIAFATGNATMATGFISVIHGGLSNLLGVYSGRINKESDLGMVWKNAAIIDILTNGVTGNGNLTP